VPCVTPCGGEEGGGETSLALQDPGSTRGMPSRPPRYSRHVIIIVAVVVGVGTEVALQVTVPSDRAWLPQSRTTPLIPREWCFWQGHPGGGRQVLVQHRRVA